MASQAYMANMNLKKQKQKEEVWQKINENQKLKGLAQLHKKIEDVEEMRKNNRQFIQNTNQNYQDLKK